MFQYNIAAPVNEDDCEEDEEDDEYGAKKKEDFESDDPVERKFSIFSSFCAKSTIKGTRIKFFRILFVKLKRDLGKVERYKVCTFYNFSLFQCLYDSMKRRTFWDILILLKLLFFYLFRHQRKVKRAKLDDLKQCIRLS